MSIKTLLIVKGSCFLAAMCLALFVAQSKPKPPPQRGNERVKVVTAWQNLPAGTLLPQMFGNGVWYVKGTEPTGALTYPYELTGQRLNRDVVQGQVVTSDDLIDRATWLRDNRWPRDMVVHVEAANVVGGFLLANTHVDILLAAAEADGGTGTETVLENVPVLAMTRDNQRPTAAYMTIDVTAEQAKQLQRAKKETMRLVVRPETILEGPRPFPLRQ
jgi:Flp pilus assembly protein CpaB